MSLVFRSEAHVTWLAKHLVVGASSVLAAACFATPEVPSVATPRAAEQVITGALGVTMPPLGSSYARDGRRIDAVWTPRFTVPLLQTASVTTGLHAWDGCAVEGQASLARLSGVFRCGVGDEQGSAGASAGLAWAFAEGVVHRAALEAGYRDGGLFFVSSGAAAGAHYGRTFALEPQLQDSDGLAYRPTGPTLVVSQLEVAWSSSVAIGVPALGHSGPESLFMAVVLDVPVAFTPGAFSAPEGDPHVYAGLKPGTRVGVVLGYSGRR